MGDVWVRVFGCRVGVWGRWGTGVEGYPWGGGGEGGKGFLCYGVGRSWKGY